MGACARRALLLKTMVGVQRGGMASCSEGLPTYPVAYILCWVKIGCRATLAGRPQPAAACAALLPPNLNYLRS